MKSIVGVAVKALILDSGKILLLKRSDKSKHSAGVWETVGGRLEFGETPEEAIRREIDEETSLTVDNIELLYAEPYYMDEDTEVIVLCYICDLDKDSSKKVIISKEHSDYMWVNIDELKKKIQKIVLDTFEKNKVFEKIKSRY